MAKSSGYIDANGKYHRGETNSLAHDVSSMHKDWRHSLERKQFSREIIQPHKNGKPNPDFIRAYPKYSKKYWSQEQIDNTLREATGSNL